MTLSLIQIILAIAIISLVLLQERSSGISSFLSGAGEGGAYQTRRGLERVAFYSTIALVAIFAGLALWQVVR
jgi:protein translocase SecG subunit